MPSTDDVMIDASEDSDRGNGEQNNETHLKVEADDSIEKQTHIEVKPFIDLPNIVDKINEVQVNVPMESGGVEKKKRRRSVKGLQEIVLEEEEGPASKRELRTRRQRTSRYDFEDYQNNEEQKLIQQAIKNSKKDLRRTVHEAPEAPTFYPSVDEFKDPFGYIKKIRLEGEKCGIVKIVPPAGWKPTTKIDMTSPLRFPTKLQNIHTLQEGNGFADGRQYSIASYKDMADSFLKSWQDQYYGGQDAPLESLARDYWDAVETGTKQPTVEYGNDLDTMKYYSGFPQRLQSVDGGGHLSGVESSDCTDMFSEEYYARCGWNLNNLPHCDASLLKYIRTPINGVNVPWLYVGMLFTSFCWHTEDNYMYSINYNHFGGIKQWYGIPASEAKIFEKASKEFFLENFRDSPDLLHHMTTQISPSLLIGNGIHVFQARQQAGSFIITFPKAYHGGFSYAFNVGEAVNFATYDWLAMGLEAEERYRLVARNSVFSNQRLLFTLLHHKDELDPQFIPKLFEEALKVLEEEISYRPFILGKGVRDLSSKIKLNPNQFEFIDENGAEYDDLRTCYVCKHICIFTAIACQCDRQRVACIRHHHSLCRCPRERNYLLEWASTKTLKALRDDLKRALQPVPQLPSPPPPAAPIIKSEPPQEDTEGNKRDDRAHDSKSEEHSVAISLEGSSVVQAGQQSFVTGSEAISSQKDNVPMDIVEGNGSGGQICSTSTTPSVVVTDNDNDAVDPSQLTPQSSSTAPC